MKYRADEPYPKIGMTNCKKDADLLMNAYSGCEGSEFTALVQYIYQSYWVRNCFPEIADILEGIAKVEMHHHKLLGRAIVNSCGDPIISGSNMSWWRGDCVCYQKNVIAMLKKDILDEKAAIVDYKRLASCVCNPSLKALLERIACDEECHIRLLKMACDMLMQGDAPCQQQTSKCNCGNQNERKSHDNESCCCNGGGVKYDSYKKCQQKEPPNCNCGNQNERKSHDNESCCCNGSGVKYDSYKKCQQKELSNCNCGNQNERKSHDNESCCCNGSGVKYDSYKKCQQKEPQNCNCGNKSEREDDNCMHESGVKSSEINALQKQMQSFAQDVQQMRDSVQMHASEVQKLCNESQCDLGSLGGIGRINKI